MSTFDDEDGYDPPEKWYPKEDGGLIMTHIIEDNNTPNNSETELRDLLRALPRTERISSKYPIDAYEDDLLSLFNLYATKRETLARLDELDALKVYSVPMYGLVRGRTEENYQYRISSLQATLSKEGK